MASTVGIRLTGKDARRVLANRANCEVITVWGKRYAGGSKQGKTQGR